jgi:quinol monooxygenase YgiN
MIVFTMKMKVEPHNRKELLQTLLPLVESTRNEQGCLSHHVYQDMEDENSFIFVEEWQSRADLFSHLRSNTFSVLLGAANLLAIPPDMQFNSALPLQGMEALEAVREGGDCKTTDLSVLQRDA